MSYNFPQRRGECLSITARKKSQNWFAFSTDENSETLESSAMYIVLAYLMLFAALTNAVCMNDAFFFFSFFIDLCKCF